MTTPILLIPEIANGTVNQYLVANQSARSLESAITGYLDINLASGNSTLTVEQFVGFSLFRAVGNSIARTITVPTRVRIFYIFNSGSASVGVVNGTTTISVPPGEGAAFFSDGVANGLFKVSGGGSGGSAVQNISVACSDEVTAITTGVKTTFRMPYGFSLIAVRASLTAAQSSGSAFTIDIKQNGSSILSTLLTIDNAEKTSSSAATPPVIDTSPLTDDAEITVEVTQVGDGTAKGLKVYFIGSSL